MNTTTENTDDFDPDAIMIEQAQRGYVERDHLEDDSLIEKEDKECIQHKKEAKPSMYPNMDKIQELAQHTNAWERMFPSLEFNHGGENRFGQCIGFMMGLWVSGQKDQAEEFAKTFFRSFHFGMEDSTRNPYDDQREISSWNLPLERRLMVSDDGTFLGFTFCLYNLVDNPDKINESYLDLCIKLKQHRHGYVDYYYTMCFNGGILFHGLQEVFSVSLGGGSGWQMHT